MNSKDYAIGILSTTAVILLVGLVIIQTRPEPVFASGMTAWGGDYLVSVGRVQKTEEDLLYVIDTAEQKLIVYACDLVSGRVGITDQVDLRKLRESSASPPAQPPRGQPQPTRGRPRP